MRMDMKAQLENYNVLFVLMGICAFAVLMKAVSYGMFHKLLWDSNQMGTTRNRWMKAMMSGGNGTFLFSGGILWDDGRMVLGDGACESLAFVRAGSIGAVF